MKNKKSVLCSLLIMLAGVICFSAQAQQKKDARPAVETKNEPSSSAPKGIVRTIKQDRKGNIWITSWEGVFKYDGKSFVNITSKASSARFFSVLEDRKGNFWFASIGSGVYNYDGKSFRNFTTKDGLASNSVTSIYEDKTGNIWFGTESGASRYDPSAALSAGEKSFQNLKMNEASPVAGTDSVYVGADSAYHGNDSVYHGADSVYHGTDSVYHGANAIHTNSDSVYVGSDSAYVGANAAHNQTDSVRSSSYQQPLPKAHWTHNDVNAIIEDKTGKFWFGTRGYATVYDGKTFTTITNNDGKPFTNVRSIIKDKKGNIWLGGADGLWRYDGKIFTNFTQQFVGYIYEDKRGNIWTSSERSNNLNSVVSGNNANSPDWALSRYEEKSLSDKKPTVTEITTKPMIFGILEDGKGNIWFGGFDGVYRYDGKTITDFKSKAGPQ